LPDTLIADLHERHIGEERKELDAYKETLMKEREEKMKALTG